MGEVTLQMMQSFEAKIEGQFKELSEQIQKTVSDAVGAIDKAVMAKLSKDFEEADKAFKSERERVDATVTEMGDTIKQLTGDSLNNLLKKIHEIDEREATFKDLLGQMYTNTTTANETRFAQLNYQVDELNKKAEFLPSS